MLSGALLARHLILLTIVPGAIAFGVACLAVAHQRRHVTADGRRCSYSIVGLSAAFFAVCWTVHVVAWIAQAVNPGAWVVQHFWLVIFLAQSILAIVPIIVLAVYVSPVHRIVRSIWLRRLATGFASMLLLAAIAAQVRIYDGFAQEVAWCAKLDRLGEKPDPRCSAYHCMALVADHRCL
jgi:hypothetical protein